MRCSIAVLLGCLLLLGCRQNPYLDATIEIMNAERRGLEDRLYELEYRYEEQVEELDRLKQENERLRSEPASRVESRPSSRPRGIQRPREQREEERIDPLREPEIIVPDEAEELEAPAPRATAMPRSLELSPPQVTREPFILTTPVSAVPVFDPVVTHLRIKRRSLRGVDFDEASGDDGIFLIVEPLNATDEIVRRAGKVSVAVLDLAFFGQKTEQARVARWELTEQEVERFLNDSPAQDGIHLNLLWPDAPPQHERLRVFVRYVTEDNQRLETHEDVRVSLANRLSFRWTPRATRTAGDAVTVPPSRGSGDPVAVPEWSPFR